MLGPASAAQECDCDFITSGTSVIDGVLLEKCKKTHNREPLKEEELIVIYGWEPPNYTKSYLVCNDVGRGDGQDYSGFPCN